MLDHIMGKSDAVIMREKMEVMRNEEEGMENRMVAMDDYEMVSGSREVEYVFSLSLLKSGR